VVLFCNPLLISVKITNDKQNVTPIMLFLGALGLIDEGEADWKILTIDARDPLANKLNNITDIETMMPGLLNATHDWFKFYKVPTGKPVNQFALGGSLMGGIFFDRQFAVEIINHDHRSWKKLIAGQYPNAKIQLANTIAGSTKHQVSPTEAEEIMRMSSQDYNAMAVSFDDMQVNGVSYINRDEY